MRRNKMVHPVSRVLCCVCPPPAVYSSTLDLATSLKYDDRLREEGESAGNLFTIPELRGWRTG